MKNLTKLLSIVILFLLLNTILSAAPTKVTGINVNELIELKHKGVKIIDIRKPKNLEKSGIIPTSFLLNFYKEDGTINKEKWLKAFINLVKNTKIKFVLISTDGTKAKYGAELLYEKGYSSPLYLIGGIEAWITAKEQLIKISTKK